MQKKLWNFLTSETEAEEFLIKNNKEFLNDPNDSTNYGFFMNPYVQTSLFISETINLDMMLTNGFIKLSEKPNTYKDRYTSVSYGNWVASYFDQFILKEKSSDSDWDVLQRITIIS